MSGERIELSAEQWDEVQKHIGSTNTSLANLTKGQDGILKAFIDHQKASDETHRLLSARISEVERRTNTPCEEQAARISVLEANVNKAQGAIWASRWIGGVMLAIAGVVGGMIARKI